MFYQTVSFLKEISKYSGGGDWAISGISSSIHLISDSKYGVWARKRRWGGKDL